MKQIQLYNKINDERKQKYRHENKGEIIKEGAKSSDTIGNQSPNMLLLNIEYKEKE